MQPASPAVLIANVSAILALVMMMLGVGIAVGPGLKTLHRSLDRPSMALTVLANLLVVPAVCAAFLLAVRPDFPVTVAVLLLACFPAGPISLVFVRQEARQLARSTATVLWLQLVSVVASPLLLLALGRLVLGAPIVAQPRAAAVSMASQMVALEIAPIFVGAWLGTRLGASRERVRAQLRWAALAFLASAGLAFGSLYYDAFFEGLSAAARGFFVLLGVSWAAGMLLRGRSTAHDAGQIAGLRNISLSIVVAGTTRGLQGAVVFVLVGAGIVTAGAPLLRLLGRVGAQGGLAHSSPTASR